MTTSRTARRGRVDHYRDGVPLPWRKRAGRQEAAGTCTGREAAHAGPAWSVGEPMASKLRLHPRGPALGKVLGDDPDLNSLYPEIAEATDLGATLRSNIRESLPVEIGRGRHLKLCYEPPVSSSARQQSSRSLWLPGPDGRSGLPEPRRARQSFTFCP